MHEGTDTYRILYALSDAVFYFLPIAIAISAAKKLNVNIMLALAAVGFLLYPDLVSLLGGDTPTKLFGFIPVYHASYGTSLLPAIFAVLLLKGFDWIFNKIIPNVVKFMFTPFLSLIFTGIIVIFTLAPLGNLIGEYIAIAMNWLYGKVPWLTIGILGAAFPFLVMTGMHWAFVPIHFIAFGETGLGYDSWIVVMMFMPNIAQGAASLAVGFRTKDKNMKSLAISSGFLATFLGITEPAMYGVNLKLKKPMWVVAAVSGVAGVLAGILGLTDYVIGQGTSLLGILGYINPSGNINNFIYAWIVAGVSFFGTFIITFLISGDNFAITKSEKLIKKVKAEKNTIYNPIQGNVIPLKEVNDATFASEVLGMGYAVQPTSNVVRAPFDGTVEVVMDSKHAVGIKSEDGMQVLIHVGLDTVKLNGKHFKNYVKVGDSVKLGQKLISFNSKEIQKAGYELTTPVILTNSAEFTNVNVVKSGKHEICDKMIYLDNKEGSNE